MRAVAAAAGTQVGLSIWSEQWCCQRKTEQYQQQDGEDAMHLRSYYSHQRQEVCDWWYTWRIWPHEISSRAAQRLNPRAARTPVTTW